MKAIFFFILCLFFLPQAPAPGADSCDRYEVSPGPGNAPKKEPRDGFQYVQDCWKGKNWERVEKSVEVKRLLGGFSRMVGQNLPVYSCFRSQSSQDAILCRNKCAPRFGTANCVGRIAESNSEHTVGVAADFFVLENGNLSPSSFRDPKALKEALKREGGRLCGLLAQNRKENNSGWGGITVYGVDPQLGKAFLHLDAKKDWCNWGVCEDFLGEGHCKRTKFRTTEARLLQSLADAEKAKAQEEVARLRSLVQKLQADCPPGDLSCRDLYKTL